MKYIVTRLTLDKKGRELAVSRQFSSIIAASMYLNAVDKIYEPRVQSVPVKGTKPNSARRTCSD